MGAFPSIRTRVINWLVVHRKRWRKNMARAHMCVYTVIPPPLRSVARIPLVQKVLTSHAHCWPPPINFHIETVPLPSPLCCIFKHTNTHSRWTPTQRPNIVSTPNHAHWTCSNQKWKRAQQTNRQCAYIPNEQRILTRLKRHKHNNNN